MRNMSGEIVYRCPYGASLMSGGHLTTIFNGFIVPHFRDNLKTVCEGSNKEWCDCHLYKNQICDICQKRNGSKTVQEEKRSFAGGKLTSTKQPRLSLIPHAGLVNAAERFEHGLETHKDAAYNGLKDEIPTDKDWLIERASHAAEHCFCIIDKLKNNDYTLCAKDAGAVAWFGLVMGEVAVKLRERQLDNSSEAKQAGIK